MHVYYWYVDILPNKFSIGMSIYLSRDPLNMYVSILTPCKKQVCNHTFSQIKCVRTHTLYHT